MYIYIYIYIYIVNFIIAFIHTNLARVTELNCLVGHEVRRGPDWEWGNQDHNNGVPGVGVITKCGLETGWGNKGVRAKWNSGTEDTYRMGVNDKYDLILEQIGKRQKYSCSDLG